MNIEKVLKQAVEEYKEFAYDGCHKIYIIENEEEKQKAQELKYAIIPIEELENVYYSSCPLRFVDFWNLDKPGLIPQF